jgi:hypothetical protein
MTHAGAHTKGWLAHVTLLWLCRAIQEEHEVNVLSHFEGAAYECLREQLRNQAEEYVRASQGAQSAETWRRPCIKHHHAIINPRNWGGTFQSLGACKKLSVEARGSFVLSARGHHHTFIPLARCNV